MASEARHSHRLSPQLDDKYGTAVSEAVRSHHGLPVLAAVSLWRQRTLTYDTPFHQNFIFFIGSDNNTGTHPRRKMQCMTTMKNETLSVHTSAP